MADSVSLVREWPVAELNRFIDAKMRDEGIKNDAELARLAGLKQNQISTIRTGKSQPSIPTLDKIAVPLDVPPRNLYVMAGHVKPGDDEPSVSEILPSEIRDLIDLYKRTTSDEGRSLIRQQVGVAVRGLSALITDPTIDHQPNRRRSA